MGGVELGLCFREYTGDAASVGDIGGEDRVGGGVHGEAGGAGHGGDGVGEGFEFANGGEADVGATAEEEEGFVGGAWWVGGW